jgi:peptidoglycan/LPS O-acetylase OafA/YrhL
MQPTSHPRIAALDGLRGLAVAAVLAYHAGFAWAGGGFLGVSLFFTLSGYLICSLLVEERAATGTVDLRRFWARRARRLLPAALAALGLALAFAVVAGSSGQLVDLRGDVLAALGYVANWRFVLDGTSYGELGQAPSPLQHFWSLAIEEQFYVVFPLVVLALGRRLGLALALGLAGSVGAMVLVQGDVTRAYYGTDTRAAEVLVGAALAVWATRRREPGRLARAAGPLALGLLVWSWVVVDQGDGRLYAGGLLVHAAVAAIVLRSASGLGPLSDLLAVAPLQWLGRISYGAYLYHWPIFLWLSPERTGLEGAALAVVRVACSLALAEVSLRVLEEPIRHGRRLSAAAARPALVLGVAAVVLVAVLVPAPAMDPLARVLDGQAAGLIAPPAAPSSIVALRSPATEAPAPMWPSTLIEASTAAAVSSAATTSTTAPPSPFRAVVPGERVRVYVAGDSNALAVGLELATWGQDHGVDVWTSGWLGCHLVTGGEYRYAGESAPTTDKCNGWREERRHEIADVGPHVVFVITGSFDVLDRRLPERDFWQHIGEPAFDALLRDEVARLAGIAIEAGSRVVWATHPAIRTGTVDGVPPKASHPEHDVARIDRLNRLVAEVLAGRGGVSMLDLRGHMAGWPGGELDPQRRPDGIHPGSAVLPDLAAWIGPQLVAAAASAS